MSGNPALVAVQDYAKDGGPGAVLPSCGIYHDPLQY